MTTREQLLEKLEKWRTGRGLRLYSEVESLLSSMYEYLAPETVKEKEESLFPFIVTIELSATYLAKDENEAWDMALAALEQRDGMEITDHTIWKSL